MHLSHPPGVIIAYYERSILIDQIFPLHLVSIDAMISKLLTMSASHIPVQCSFYRYF